MRIGDVTALERMRVQDGKLFLYTQKTGTPVYLPLPEVALEGTRTGADRQRALFLLEREWKAEERGAFGAGFRSSRPLKRESH
jgi:hypothetical protein